MVCVRLGSLVVALVTGSSVQYSVLCAASVLGVYESG